MKHYTPFEADARITEMESLLRCWLVNHIGGLAPRELYETALRTSELLQVVKRPTGCGCWETVNALIRRGDLPTDWETEQRNGIVLAANAIAGNMD